MIKGSAVVQTPYPVPSGLLPDDLGMELSITMTVKQWKAISACLAERRQWPYLMVANLINALVGRVVITQTEAITEEFAP